MPKARKRRVHGIAAVIAAALVAALPAAVWAQDKPDAMPSADEIVEKANRVAYYQGGDGRADVTMTIFDADKNQRTREMTILRWDAPDPKAPEGRKTDDYCGKQRFYVYFHRPADVDKMAFLVWKNPDPKTDDDRWLYVPALDLVRRISSSDKRTSFVGSHFYYEDVSGRSPEDDTHELLAEQSEGNYYVLKHTPKDPKAVEFAHYVTWIHKKTFMVVQTDYYDTDGKKYREYKVLGAFIYKDPEDESVQYPTVRKARMSDLKTGGYTVLEYADVKYNVGLTKDIFEERYLKRPPHEYLK